MSPKSSMVLHWMVYRSMNAPPLSAGMSHVTFNIVEVNGTTRTFCTWPGTVRGTSEPGVEYEM